MIRQAKHIFKLDPAKEIDDTSLAEIVKSDTDLILVSGTDNVTENNVLDLLVRIRRFNVPLALEISHPEAVVPGFDHYFIPTVINTTDVKFTHGMLIEALVEYRNLIDYEDISLLPYIIMNEQCKAFKHAGCHTAGQEEFIAMVNMLDKLYKMDYIYIEYSGALGDATRVKEAFDETQHSRIIYGGGITSKETAQLMSSAADTIVVGNIIYDDITQALKTII